MKHLTVPPESVDAAIREHQMFYWELIGTDTVDHVSMQAGAGGVWGDGLFFVPYQQRTAYTKINFRRSAGIACYDQVREVERQYVEAGQQIVELLHGQEGRLLVQEEQPGGAEVVLAVLLGLVAAFCIWGAIVSRAGRGGAVAGGLEHRPV